MKNTVILIGLLFWGFVNIQAQPHSDYVLKSDLPIDKSNVLAIENNNLFYAKNNTLFIIDITDPESLVLIKELELENSPSDLEVSGDKLFIAIDRRGVYCYDIEIKDSPLLLGIYAADYLYQRLECLEDEIFLIHSQGLEILDYSDPARPELVQYVSMSTMPTAIQEYDDYLLVSTFDELSIYDVHSPEFPSKVYTLDIPFAMDIEVVDEIALVTTLNTIYSVDLTNLFYPKILNILQDPFQIGQMDVENKKIYGCGASGNMVVLKEMDGVISFINGIKTAEHYQDIIVEGNYAFVLNKKGGLDVFNVSNDLDIRKVAHFDEAFYPQVYFVF